MTEGLIALVKTKSNLTDVIGVGTDADPLRMYPDHLPQGLSTFPAISYKELLLEPSNTFDGASTLDFHRIDIQFYSRTSKATKDLFNLFRTEIEDTVGTYGGVNIHHIWFQTSGLADFIDNLKLYIKHAEYKIAVRR